MTEATVELLAAEVRTLMVGKRQVTLSVFRQLDRVEPAEVAPFGRVRDKEENGVEVVGRHTDTGALVRSHCRSVARTECIYPKIDGWAFTPWGPNPNKVLIRSCAGISILASLTRATYSHRSTQFTDDDTAHLERDGWCYYDAVVQARVEALADRKIAEIQALLPLYEAWSSLPLIVLAGLR